MAGLGLAAHAAARAVSEPAALTDAPGPGFADVVTAFYRVLLLREPDADGLQGHTAALASGSLTLEQTLAAFFRSDEFQSLAPRVLETHANAASPRFTNDHSQYGEFGILLRHWLNTGARHRIVVDVGARGRERSNAYDLMREFGWRGLLIEANPALIDPIRADFAGLDMTLLHCAISDHEGRASLHLGINDDVSSLDPASARAWGDIQGTVMVDVRRLGPVLHAHHLPPDFDLLSLDIEGEDLRVLNDLIDTTPYRPRSIVIEASFNYATRSLDALPLSDRVRTLYRIIGQTPANLILAVTA